MSVSRGSKLSRAIQFFREASYDEARVAHILVNEIMSERTRRESDKSAKTPAPKRTPKPKPAATKPAQALDPAADFPANESLASA
jgi:hypothetical protein